MNLVLVLLATIRAAVALHPAPTLLPRPCSCRQRPPHPASSASADGRRLGHQVHPSHHAPRDRRARAPPTPARDRHGGSRTCTYTNTPVPDTQTHIPQTLRPRRRPPSRPKERDLNKPGGPPGGSIFNRWKGVNFQPLLTRAVEEPREP